MSNSWNFHSASSSAHLNSEFYHHFLDFYLISAFCVSSGLCKRLLEPTIIQLCLSSLFLVLHTRMTFYLEVIDRENFLHCYRLSLVASLKITSSSSLIRASSAHVCLLLRNTFVHHPYFLLCILFVIENCCRKNICRE